MSVADIRSEIIRRTGPDCMPPTSDEIAAWAAAVEAVAVTPADWVFARRLRTTAILTRARFNR